ncbi:MAG TPA: 4Fe-4S binding protein [Acidobacteriota bacterium]|nr:4Fe-4S binding protein [Acidobacteriota bacterium]
MKKRVKPRDKRVWSQAVSALAINAWLPNWLTGGIFQGNIKGICVPVLNCYSCPSALGACPVGAMQTMMGGLRFNLSVAEKKFGLYVAGLMGISGSIAGRWTCGWLCPFGFLQELMYKIPTPKINFPKVLSYARYAFLAVMVLILPVLIVDQFGYGQTWFCKWVCPAGTLEAGIPLVLLNKGLRPLVGFMYYWKVAILFLFLGLMTVSRRPFCRAVCPLGAFLGLFNKVSFFRMVVDDEKCIRCGACRKDCPVDHRIDTSPNSPDCIRCLRCVSSCKYGAVSYDFPGKRKAGEDLPSASPV